MEVTGLTETTILNGDIVYDKGVLYNKPGSGQFLKREPYGHAYERIDNLSKRRDPRNFKVDR